MTSTLAHLGLLVDELMSPREPFPSPDSYRGLEIGLGVLLCAWAAGLWFSRRPRGEPRGRADPVGKALRSLEEAERWEEEGMAREEYRLLASRLGALLRELFETRLGQPCMGLPQERFLLLIASRTPQGAMGLRPLLSKWEGVVYARRPWGHEERRRDLEAVRTILEELGETQEP